MVIEVPASQIGEYLHYFDGVQHLRTIIDTLSIAGRLWVDDLTDPTIALAGYQYIYVFAGKGDYAAVTPFLELIPAGMSFIAANTKDFLPYFQQFFNSKLHEYTRTSFSCDSLHPAHLKKLREQYNYVVEKVQKNNIWSVPQQFLFFLPYTYKKLRNYVNNGLAFFTRDTRGEVVAIISALAPILNHTVEVQVNTKEGKENRRKGYATAACTEFLLYCLKNNIKAHWDADNEISRNLALKLGYTLEEDYVAYYWA